MKGRGQHFKFCGPSNISGTADAGGQILHTGRLYQMLAYG